MGAGNKYVKINSLERAVSTDFNRMQSLGEADSHEFSRHLVNREIAGDFYNFPGMAAPYTALPAANQFLIPHDCLSGLMVRPDNATGLLIDPGEGAFFVPAFSGATPDDSKYVYVSSAGVSNVGDLPFVANGGPGIRWDIVECQPTDLLLESSSRDTYNPANGQFVNALVDKVRGGALTFRIRAGTQGAGIPDPDPAWMPLAAVHVRADATGFTNCDVYDIRPLVSERCVWSPNTPLSPPTGESIGCRMVLYESEMTPVFTAGVNGLGLGGYFRGHFGGYWTGGRIRRNMPASSTASFGATAAADPNTSYFNAEAAQNKSASFSIAGDDTFTVCAFFPRGYPRWVRYSETSLAPAASNHLRKSGRLPQGPRGLLWVEHAPATKSGLLVGTPPTVLGETAGAWGHVVVEGLTNGTTDFYPARGGVAGQTFWHSAYQITAASGATPTARTRICTGQNLPAAVVTTNGGGTASSLDFSLLRQHPIPPYARSVHLTVEILIIGTAATDEILPQAAYTYMVTGSDTGTPVNMSVSSGRADNTPNTWRYTGVIEVPLIPQGNFDSGVTAGTQKLSVIISHGAGIASLTGLAFVEGYTI